LVLLSNFTLVMTKGTERVGYRRLRDVDERREVADAQLLERERGQKAQPGRVTQRLKGFGKRGQRRRRRREGTHAGHLRLIDAANLTAVVVSVRSDAQGRGTRRLGHRERVRPRNRGVERGGPGETSRVRCRTSEAWRHRELAGKPVKGTACIGTATGASRALRQPDPRR
jgi:hypothetical protein